MYRRELLKGSTETLILSLLSRQPLYGYQLVRDMRQRSGGYFLFKEGTLYPALHRLERQGLVEGRWQLSPSRQPRRYYYITSRGTASLEALMREWREFAQAVNQVMQPEMP